MSWVDDLLRKHPDAQSAERDLRAIEDRHDAQVRDLTERVDKLSAENAKLLEQRQGKLLPADGELHSDARAVLEALYRSGSKDIPAAVISAKLKMDPAKTQLYLNRLADKEYIFTGMAIGQDTVYSLDDRGTEYLVEIGVIK